MKRRETSTIFPDDAKQKPICAPCRFQLVLWCVCVCVGVVGAWVGGWVYKCRYEPAQVALSLEG